VNLGGKCPTRGEFPTKILKTSPRDHAGAACGMRWRNRCDAGNLALVTHRFWPLFDLRLRIGTIELRPIADADLTPLANLKPLDVELNPANPVYAVAPGRIATGITVHQSLWQSRGAWRPESWNLEFTVVADGAVVGVQCLEADEFARRRTVDSASWLITDARGRGIGKAMRLAVLALAFDGLGAEMAVTEAWHDNHGSLGVSRSLGYVDNGFYRHDRAASADFPEAGVDDMARMRLSRAEFINRHPYHGVVIENLEPCLPYFGLG